MQTGNWLIWVLGGALIYWLLKPKVPAGAGLKPQEAQSALAADKNAQLVDVRTPMEFGGGHIRGARNIPLDQIGRRLDELKKDRPVIVYCRSGHRSAMALGTLRKAGFDQAKHIEGGFTAWKSAGL